MNELCLAINPALFPLKLGLGRQIEIALRKINAIGYLKASIFCAIKLKRREKKKIQQLPGECMQGGDQSVLTSSTSYRKSDNFEVERLSANI